MPSYDIRYLNDDGTLADKVAADCADDTKAKVLAHLEPLIAATKADELMVTTMIFGHEARKHSYELLAKAFGLKPTPN